MIALVTIALSVVASFWRAWVALNLWRWFIMPIFGLPDLSIAALFGLSALITMFVYHHTPEVVWKDVSEIKRSVETLLMAFLLPTICLIVGSIARLFL